MTAAAQTTTAEKQNASAAQGAAQDSQIVRRVPTPMAAAEIGDLDSAWRWSQNLAQSSIIPASYRGSPANVFAAIILAQELQLSPMLVMRDVYFINDRPTMYAELKLALVRRSSTCEYITCLESSATKAVWEAKRRGSPKPARLEVNIEQISPALRKKETWQAYPANMLRWRCAAWLCDMEFSDVTLGIRTRDEMDDVVDAPTSPLEGKHVPAGVQAVGVPAASAPTPEAEPHDAVTGEVVAEPAPAAAATSTDLVEQLFAEIKAAKSGKVLDELRELKVDAITPKGHPRRQEIGRLLSARRQELSAEEK